MKLSSIVRLIAVTNVVYAGDKPLPPYFEDLRWEAPRSLSNWSNLTVKTRTGTFIGMLNETYPNVRQFLRVPFAQVSVSPSKWISDFKLTIPIRASRLLVIFAGCLHRSFHLRAENTMLRPMVPVWCTLTPRIKPLLMIRSFLSACPQYVQREDSFWKDYEPASFVINLGENLTQGSVAWSSAEDCLSIAIWTPASAKKTSKLPVTLFATGGAGVEGGIRIPAHLPTQWVSRSQGHIAITMNYRVNIFGSMFFVKCCW